MLENQNANKSEAPIESGLQNTKEDAPQEETDSTEGALSQQPVGPKERYRSIDVLRGFAVLGILAMNIVFFAWPMAGYENPVYSGGTNTINVSAWVVNSMFFSGKMMSIFSILFGAGLVLMTDRAEAIGKSNLGVHYRRMFWLFCIGMLHAYFIWSGDILVMYALCGIPLYLFRRRSPRFLIIFAIILVGIQLALGYGFSLYGSFISDVAAQVDAELAAGNEPEAWKVEVHKGWNKEMRAFMAPNQSDVDRMIEDYRGSYLDIVKVRAPEVLMFQVFGFLFFGLWGAGARMMLGMALMKLGVLTGKGDWPFYKKLAMIGYGIGLPLTVLGIVNIYTNNFSPLDASLGTFLVGLGMVPVALGHIAIVMMACKSSLSPKFLDMLAATGRMALTHYLMQSVICTTLFYGYGGNLFARLGRLELWGIVLVIWAIQLMISPIWLKHFRFGPAEWFWRSLTYWRRQPFRNQVAA